MALSNILFPTDFSGVASNALGYAAAIAKKQKGKIHLVHVYQKPYDTVARSGGFTASLDVRTHEKLRDSIATEIEKLARSPQLKGLALSKLILSDIPVWEITQHAGKKVKTDIIVMGTRGQTRLLPGLHYGTNAARVIRYSPVPVLTIPDGVPFSPFKKIMLATNFDQNLDAFLPTVIEFAKMFDAEVIVGVINTRGNFNVSNLTHVKFEALKAKAAYKKLSLVEHNSEEVEQGLAYLVRDRKIDMMAMLTHGYTAIQRLLEGSIAEDLSTDLRIPLLTYQNPAKKAPARKK